MGNAHAIDASSREPSADSFAVVIVRSAVPDGVVFAIVAVIVLTGIAFRLFTFCKFATLVGFTLDAFEVVGVWVVAKTAAINEAIKK